MPPRAGVRRRGREGGASPLKALLVFGAIVAAGVIGQVVWGGVAAPDPHYVEAKRLVAEYELGKPEHLINYNHPVYAKALTQLELVDPDSPSAQPAAEMAADLRRKIDAFRARLEQEAQKEQAESKRRREREEMFLEAQERARLNPVTAYPECDEGNKRPPSRRR